MKWLHVTPVNDLIEHNTDMVDGKYTCPCDPKIEVGNQLIMHNSMDRREVFEQELIRNQKQ